MLFNPSANLTPATLTRITDLADGTIRQFEIIPDGGPLPYGPGAHLPIRVEIAGQARMRHYSLLGGNPRGGYRIAVKRQSPGQGGSAWLWSLAEGARVAIGAPANHFSLSAGQPPRLLIAGGIGVTPLLAMAGVLAGGRAPLAMIYAGRTRAQMAFADDLSALLGDRLHLHEDETAGRLDLPALLAPHPMQTEAYVCGPLPMMEAVRRAWDAAGRPASLLRFETFGNSGHYPAGSFTVSIPRHGLELTVPADRSLLSVLDEAGAEVLADCLRGECGLCTLKILAHDGPIDHRDVFLSPHQQQAGEVICACVSRMAAGGRITLDTADRAG